MAADKLEYNCIHEELIQSHSKKIAGLEAKAEYKERRSAGGKEKRNRKSGHRCWQSFL